MVDISNNTSKCHYEDENIHFEYINFIIVKRIISLLKNEFSITDVHTKLYKTNIRTFRFYDVSTSINITSNKTITIVFTYQESLIEEIFSKYIMFALDPDEDKEALIEDTANDLLNVVTGNILPDIKPVCKNIILSCPIIIKEPYLNTENESKVYLSEITTKFGNMFVLCYISENH